MLKREQGSTTVCAIAVFDAVLTRVYPTSNGSAVIVLAHIWFGPNTLLSNRSGRTIQ
jgi:hypothetical protein